MVGTGDLNTGSFFRGMEELFSAPVPRFHHLQGLLHQRCLLRESCKVINSIKSFPSASVDIETSVGNRIRKIPKGVERLNIHWLLPFPLKLDPILLPVDPFLLKTSLDDLFPTRAVHGSKNFVLCSVREIECVDNSDGSK